MTQVMRFNKNRRNRENTFVREKKREDEAFYCHFEGLVGLKYAAVPSTSPRVVILPSEDAIRTGGMQTKVPERSRSARIGLGKDEVLQFGIAVGEAEPTEHRS